MTDQMRLEIVEGVAHLVIDRPAQRNAMSTAMWQSLSDHVSTIRETDGVSAVVLSGTGGSFCAGGDLAELRTPRPGHAEHYRELAETTVLALSALEQPRIALIDGPCFGAGCSLALACDVRISSPASRFGIPALRNGLVYEAVFVRRLVEVVGPGPASLLLYGAGTWTAAEATGHGLVDRLTDDPRATVEDVLATLRSADASAVATTARAIRTTAPSH